MCIAERLHSKPRLDLERRMSDDNARAEEIRQEMQAVRARLDGKFNGVVTNARRLFDWQRYYEKSPWVATGLAFALGYVVVPRRSTLTPDEETRKAISGRRRLVVSPQQTTFISDLGKLLLSISVRIGIRRVAAQIAAGASREQLDRGEPIEEKRI